jgi:serine/threonine-protein kinase
MVKCFSCGTEVTDSSRFCSSCGQAIGKETLATQTFAIPATKIPSSSSLDDSRFLPGTLLAGRYRIVALLGRGGMGEVYRADDLTLGQQVALKFLPADAGANDGALVRFRSEVRMARQVSHPNVCRVYDVGEIDSHLFLSMEYVDGEDLGSLLRRIGRLPSDKALEIARKLCAGLAAAHDKGVLHRDLKPANIMLDGRGQVLLTDFGLAGLADQITGAEVRNGTPAYMAPEQLAGKEVTVKSDIYSLGLVLYEIFTGKRPFEANTLADLVRMRTESAPASLSSLVRDLDPTVERVILRCLDPEPANRPSSALAVSAALPGGDPLAAALAAGETPSPQMVAAAGEGTGLAPRVAIPLFAGVILALLIYFVLANRASALEQIRPPFSPEVLAQKARDVIQLFGYTDSATDDAYGFSWDTSFVRHVEQNDKPFPQWVDVIAHRPAILSFWYRQSQQPLTTVDFFDDLMSPGIVQPDEPSPIRSGMIGVELDYQGRLISFRAIPPQLQQPGASTSKADWSRALTAAGLDIGHFQATEPLWTDLPAADERVAWTGKWPGTSRPLRIEATAWKGKLDWFTLIGPWTKPNRMPAPTEAAGQTANKIVICLVLVLYGGAIWLARRNYRRGKGDRHGALRLAAAMFGVQLALWLFRTHFVLAIGMFAEFVIAISTSLFYAGVIWTLYLALEPYVRQHWPQTIISWSRVLAGHIRDPIVGRDVLFGVALGMSWALIYRIRYLPMRAFGASPELTSTDFLTSAKNTIGACLMHVPYGVRGALGFFFLLFVFRVLLRNQWLAAIAFVLLFAVPKFVRSDYIYIDAPAQLLIYGIAAVMVVRFGLITLAVGIFVADLLLNVPVTLNTSAWYFPSTVFVLLGIAALATWAFHASVKGRQFWKQDLLG